MFSIIKTRFLSLSEVAVFSPVFCIYLGLIHIYTLHSRYSNFHSPDGATIGATTVVLFFYRAMLCIRGTNQGPVSVWVCVCHKSEFY